MLSVSQLVEHIVIIYILYGFILFPEGRGTVIIFTSKMMKGDSHTAC
jgi:hypothetical protein